VAGKRNTRERKLDAEGLLSFKGNFGPHNLYARVPIPSATRTISAPVLNQSPVSLAKIFGIDAAELEDEVPLVELGPFGPVGVAVVNAATVGVTVEYACPEGLISNGCDEPMTLVELIGSVNKSVYPVPTGRPTTMFAAVSKLHAVLSRASMRGVSLGISAVLGLVTKTAYVGIALGS